MNYAPPEPRCPEWCCDKTFPGLAEFLMYHGGNLPAGGVDPPLTLREHRSLSNQEYPVDATPDKIIHHTEVRGIISSFPRSPSVVRKFAPKLVRIFGPLPSEEFLCEICGPSQLLRTSPPRTQCQHYVSCSECQARIVQKLLRCSQCCRHLTGEYPLCGDECENLCYTFAQLLQTGNCPRCDAKLSKELCSPVCNRKKIGLYKRCQERLTKHVAAMVMDPHVCSTSFPGARPCCHYTRCEKHDKITRGRSQRCSQCRSSSRPRGRRTQPPLPPQEQRRGSA